MRRAVVHNVQRAVPAVQADGRGERAGEQPAGPVGASDEGDPGGATGDPVVHHMSAGEEREREGERERERDGGKGGRGRARGKERVREKREEGVWNKRHKEVQPLNLTVILLEGYEK